MKLEQAQELYTDYMEGTLSPAMRLALEQHFERDAEAREDYKSFCLIVNSFGQVSIPELEPPSGLRASVLERVSRENAVAENKPSLSVIDSIRDWFGASQVRRFGAVGAAAVVAAVVVAGLHGRGGAGHDQMGTMVPGINAPAVTSTVLGVGIKGGDDGNQYHLFKVHLPPSVPEATVTAEVLTDDSQITDAVARSQHARQALKQPVDLTSDEELDIPVALLQSVPDSATITLLVQWQPSDSQPAGEQVVFTPANATPSATVSAGPDSSQGFYDALQYIASTYHVTVISDVYADAAPTVSPWPATTDASDALRAFTAGTGYQFRQMDATTYQVYK